MIVRIEAVPTNTDHKPLLGILGPKKGVPAVAAARLQRWALLLAAYQYDIEFRSTKAHGNADALSRLPLQEGNKEKPSETRMCNLRQIESLPLSSKTVSIATRRDPILSKVRSYILRGWPEQVAKSLQPYRSRIAELTVEEGCLLWGGRVIIPSSLQTTVLAELHKEHIGISRMKALARSHVWWTGMDKDIENTAKACESCQSVKQAPSRAPLHPWIWPGQPWQRLHIDFAGPFMEKSFLIVVDAHSKWADVVEMSSTTTARTITALRRLFANHGIPEQIVSDNGPQFISSEFEGFMRRNGIRHTRVSPYHPAANGEAERFVRTFKEAMKASKGDGLTWTHRLDNFLLTYRTTPHATTGTPPCELLMGRSLRTRWDILKPNLGKHVHQQQLQQKDRYDQHTRQRVFQVGQTVMARNFRAGEDWIPGVVMQQLGPLTYLVNVSDGRVWKRHVNFLKEFRGLGTERVQEPTVEEEPDSSPSSLPTATTGLAVPVAPSTPAVDTPPAPVGTPTTANPGRVTVTPDNVPVVETTPTVTGTSSAVPSTRTRQRTTVRTDPYPSRDRHVPNRLGW